jgi:hypothetical protein
MMLGLLMLASVGRPVLAQEDAPAEPADAEDVPALWEFRLAREPPSPT